jgi:hypothetical protein
MSTNLQPKSTAQVRCIFGLARKNGLDDDLLHDTVMSVTKRTNRISQLTSLEADRVIEHLKGPDYKPRSRRTVLHHRKRAGVQQVAQPSHLGLMESIARQRGMSGEGLQKLAERIIKHYPPRTTSETNKVIEALKAMRQRDNL